VVSSQFLLAICDFAAFFAGRLSGFAAFSAFAFAWLLDSVELWWERDGLIHRQ
jgi:hypothetical protein